MTLRRFSYILTFFCLWFACLGAADDDIKPSHQRIVMQESAPDRGYTINFKNVSVIEFIQFVSKVAGVNFMFEEEDLDFNVTVVSEEPTNITNVVSALVQVLRANNFEVLDQGDNLVINKQTGGAKLATVVSDEVPFEGPSPPQMVTRVFFVHNANPSQLGALITPMLSSSALVEVSANSRHLIVTDITGNVDKIADLMKTLDAPQSSLDIDAFTVQNNSPAELVEYAKRIITPIAEGNPVIMVPQEHTSSIFIISTPYLVGRTMAILQDLDSPIQLNPNQRAKLLAGTEFFLYKIKYKPYQEIERNLLKVSQHLEEKGYPKDGVVATLNENNYIAESNSILFSGTPDVLDKVKEIMAEIDVPTSAQRQLEISNDFLMYHPKYRTGPELLASIQDVAKNLNNSNLTDPDFLNALESARWVSSTNSLVFTGDPKSLQRISEMLIAMDKSRGKDSKATEYYMYKPKLRSAQRIQEDLKDVADDMKEAGLANPELIETINSSRYVEVTNSLLFTGTPESIAEIKSLLQTIDGVAPGVQQIGAVTFLIYKIKYASGPQLLSSLKALIPDLQKADADQDLVSTLQNARYIAETNSLIFTGPPEALEKAETLAERFDIPALAEHPQVPERPSPEIFKLYKPRCLSGEDLIHTMHDFEQNLIDSGINKRELFDTINNLKWIQKTRSILVSGSEDSVNEVMELLQRFDNPASISVGETPPPLEPFDDVSFMIYKLHYHQGTEILTALKQVGVELQNSSEGTQNKNLINAINSVQWVEVTNSLLGSGDPSTLAKLRELIQNIDVPLRQIFVEVLVINTDINDLLDFGLTWASQGKITNRIGFATGNQPASSSFIESGNGSLPATFFDNLGRISNTRTPTGTDVPFATGFDLGIIGDIILHKGRTFAALGSLINALKSDQSTSIVLNQKIITQDSRNSVIFVGQNIPFTGSTVTTIGQSSQQNTANLEYRNVGFNLSVTPTIGDNDIITLNIDTEISQTVGLPPDNTSASVNGITTDLTTTTTRVHVPDGSFLVLSGQVNNTTSRSKEGFPCLGSLPVVGAAFSRTSSLKTKNNIMIFLRPKIVDDYEVYKEVTERQEDIARAEGNPDDVEESFELIKTPDDE